MKRRTDRLRAVARTIQEQQEIESGLRSARKKQMHMLPDPPVLEGLEFGCYYNPASSLGGDFYDFVRVSEGQLGIVIGDVSGHGIDAAIVMGMAKKALNIFGQASPSPETVLSRTNEALYPDLDDMTFVSASYAIFDLTSLNIAYVRAGHNPALLFTPGAASPVQTLKPRGIVLGMQKGPVFSSFTETLELQLAPGNVLFQYTDGIIEAKNRQGEEYGSARLENLLVSRGTESAKTLVAAIRDDFQAFLDGAEQEDDVTLVALKILPKT